MITAKVNPPGGQSTAEVEDSFKFTFSVEPTETGLVDRENIELIVNGQPEEFGLNSLITPNVLMGIGSIGDSWIPIPCSSQAKLTPTGS